ncbi:Protein RRP6-like 3 [Bienertia sinuspersici]
MEYKLKISIAFTFTIAVISLYYFNLHRRRRRNKANFSPQICYLSSEFKPQSTFRRLLADNSYSPFKHLQVSDCINEKSSNLHPYEDEIMTLLKNPQINSNIFEEISISGLNKSHVWVESKSQLQELVYALSEEKFFAVDTEQHSLRSFLGFTALVQISTLKEDYLVDTIALHDAFHLLQSVFSDPNIVKARVHDESLRFVLSDRAIIALAEKKPISESEIYTIISVADEDNDPLSSSYGISPSPLICSHWEDIYCLLNEEQSNSADDSLQMLLHKHLGPNGSCSLSTYNYNMLSASNLKLANESIYTQNGVRSRKLVVRKACRKELFVQKFSCKAPVYHNCRIYASDGRLLCYCDRKKLEWYLNRNLAKLMDDNPPAIMLLFEPKGRPEDEDNDFYVQSKKNMCVSCGETNHYLRMHFPEHLKSHRSHDIVLLCVDCHEVAHATAEKYKRKVATEFGVPLYVKKVVDSRQLPLLETPEVHDHQEAGVSPLQLRTAAMALLRHGPRMPIVKTYYGGREISHEDLEAALLVGMSPNGRRKFKKKRNASYKEVSNSSDGPINHSSSKTSRPSGDLNAKDQASSSGQVVYKSETNLKTPSSDFVMDSRKNAFAINEMPRALAASGISDVKDVILLDTAKNSCQSRNPLEATTSRDSPNLDDKKSNSKVSLLGHGPHGKEVVDYLLKNYGEDGIHSFCQRWREVFVDALHPRYLPVGWDVKHSGKRAFGEFSVYNPLKKPST